MNLITQPTEDTCLSACLAMIVSELCGDVSVGAVYGEFHDAYSRGRMTPVGYLMSKGLKVRGFGYCHRMDRFGVIYLLCVPSLNKEATFHSVVADCRDVLEVYDPRNDGEHKYYSGDGSVLKKDPLSVELKGHIVEVEILNVLSDGSVIM